jgi:hypothetical protein
VVRVAADQSRGGRRRGALVIDALTATAPVAPSRSGSWHSVDTRGGHGGPSRTARSSVGCTSGTPCPAARSASRSPRPPFRRSHRASNGGPAYPRSCRRSDICANGSAMMCSWDRGLDGDRFVVEYGDDLELAAEGIDVAGDG